MSPGSTNRYQDGAELGTRPLQAWASFSPDEDLFQGAGENPGLSQRDCRALLTSTIHTPVPQQSLAIRDVCLPASLPFSLRNNQVEEKSDRLRCPGTQDQVWFFSVPSPGSKAHTSVVIKGGDGGRGISGMLSMELCDLSNQKRVWDPLTVHSVLRVSFICGPSVSWPLQSRAADNMGGLWTSAVRTFLCMRRQTSGPKPAPMSLH